MVFEDLVTPLGAKKHPYKLFFLGLLFSVISFVFSLMIFKQEASLVMVFLVVVMSMPLVYFTFREEEEEDWTINKEDGILVEHSRALKFLLFLFLGFIVGFLVIYISLPDALVHQVFKTQLDTIQQINNNVSGSSINFSVFTTIFLNNLKVMIFCLIFAIFFGAGAIFILTWNASVISAAAGTYIRNTLSQYANIFGLSKVAIYFNVFVSGILRYMIHGIFEIAAYFVAALAGGIISMALINHAVKEKGFSKIAYDVSILMVIGIVLLIAGGLVEVFVTPLIFS